MRTGRPEEVLPQVGDYARSIHMMRATMRLLGTCVHLQRWFCMRLLENPEDALDNTGCWHCAAQLVAATGAAAVYCHGEATPEERRVEAAVASALDAHGAVLKVCAGVR